MIDFEQKPSYDVSDLAEIVRILRAPGGCPWDREQDHRSIRRDLLEEAYEVAEAIDEGSPEHLKEELGDLLLQVVMHARMEEEAGRTDLDGVADGICKKLIYRHPHVFGDVTVTGTGEVLANWDELKKKEKHQATAADSLSDAAATAVVLAATLIGHFFHLQIDGLAGLLVAAFILKTGWEAAKDTLDPLLGRPMDPELARDIDKLVVSHPNILGIHDLVYHDYGPGRAMMSFHAEVPADADLLEMHDIIDHIERELKEKHHIETVIHMDPVVNDERTAALRAQVEQLAHEIDPVLSIHDLRITAGPRHTNVLFDVMVPYGFRLTDSQVRGELSRGVKKLSEKYTAVIEVDHSYVEQRENP